MKRTFFFLLAAWCFGVLVPFGYAMDLSKAKAYFLSADYKAAITEGEKALSEVEEAPELDELYYLLGLSYLKDGNFLRATDIFEIILNEFKASALRGEATLGLGDAYFLKQDYQKAKTYYRELLRFDKNSRLLPSAYYRLRQCALKEGDTQEAKAYLSIIEEKYPGYAQIDTAEPACPMGGDFFTVQVGSFSKKANADTLMQKLIAKGFPAYVQDSGPSGINGYRVKVGKFKLRQEAAEAQMRLSQDGYPARICP